MSSELMLQELSDDQLEMVTGGHGTGPNITINIYIIEYNYNIVYAPVYIINSKISNSYIDNGNTYVQSNSSGDPSYGSVWHSHHSHH